MAFLGGGTGIAGRAGLGCARPGPGGTAGSNTLLFPGKAGQRGSLAPEQTLPASLGNTASLLSRWRRQGSDPSIPSLQEGLCVSIEKVEHEFILMSSGINGQTLNYCLLLLGGPRAWNLKMQSKECPYFLVVFMMWAA